MECKYRYGEVRFKSCSGFTLIEMLVVIAIIGILAALMMPSLHRAINSSKDISCQNNLRQFGVAFMMYASDFNNTLPALNAGVSGASIAGQWWSNMLAESGHVPVEQWRSENNGDTVRGIWRCPRIPDDRLWWGGGYGIHECQKSWHMYYSQYPRLSSFRRPAATYLLGDAMQFPDKKFTCQTVYCSSSGQAGGWDRTYSHQSAPVHGSSDKTNVLFWDGHTESVEYVLLQLNDQDVFAYYSQ